MKLGHKLTLALLCVLALVLGLCTLWTQDRQWERALQDARSAALANWQREADALQKGLRPDDQYSNYNQELYSRAWRYLMQPGAPRAALAVYGQDGTMLASSMPVTLAQTELARAVPGDADLQLLTAVAADGTRYFLCSGLVLLPEECVTLVSAQSLDGLFADRALRLRDAVLTQAAALAVAALLTLLFCRRMMRPLERLEAASRQIAAGAYDRRTALPGSDEIAGLSRSFDAMAAAVQEKVNDLQRHLQARDAFVAAFTHELKTPMTSMLGYADLLRGAEVPTATRRKAADFIYHESKRLEALSGRLMELMQLEHETPPALGPVRLDAVFRQTGRRRAHAGICRLPHRGAGPAGTVVRPAVQPAAKRPPGHPGRRHSGRGSTGRRGPCDADRAGYRLRYSRRGPAPCDRTFLYGGQVPRAESGRQRHGAGPVRPHCGTARHPPGTGKPPRRGGQRTLYPAKSKGGRP